MRLRSFRQSVRPFPLLLCGGCRLHDPLRQSSAQRDGLIKLLAAGIFGHCLVYDDVLGSEVPPQGSDQLGRTHQRLHIGLINLDKDFVQITGFNMQRPVRQTQNHIPAR